MENLNLVELLRDCPTGMELDCASYDNVSFDKISDDKKATYPIFCYITDEKGNRSGISFTENGCESKRYGAKCVIFPKGKSTWEGFVPPIEFKDGDVVAVTMKPEGIWIGIFKQHKETFFESHCCLSTIGEFNSKGLKNHSFIGLHLATEEEKQKLFDAIKANGYKWNAETKTLEKLVEPRFKVGDRIKYKNGKNKDGVKEGIILSITDDTYDVAVTNDMGIFIPVTDQDNWELVPNKFDITTLKAFESRVLVRDYDNRMWIPTFWGKLLEDDSNCSYLTTNGCYKYCIPYEGNQHLLGTTNDCDDFYKTWK